MSAQHECNVYLMREEGEYIDCRKIDSHVGLHAGPNDKGDLVTWAGGSHNSGRHVSGPGFNRPVAPSEPATQEGVPRKDLEAQLADCRNMICDLREENSRLGACLDGLAKANDFIRAEWDEGVKGLENLNMEYAAKSEELKSLNSEWSKRVTEAKAERDSLIDMCKELEEKLEERTAQRDAFSHELAEKRKRIMELTELTTQVAPVADNDPRFIVRMQLLEELNTALMRIWQLDLRRRQEDSF